MLDFLAGLSSKFEKVTEAEARSQQPPHPVHPSSQDSSHPMFHSENTATMSWRSYLGYFKVGLAFRLRKYYPIHFIASKLLQAVKLAVLPS